MQNSGPWDLWLPVVKTANLSHSARTAHGAPPFNPRAHRAISSDIQVKYVPCMNTAQESTLGRSTQRTYDSTGNEYSAAFLASVRIRSRCCSVTFESNFAILNQFANASATSSPSLL